MILFTNTGVKMRVCDWIANYLYSIGVKHVHGLMGGGASGLNDGFIKHGAINYICYHHEQGAGHAAIGESKYTGELSVVNPTTGCGGTNCATSVLDAWQDGVPVLFLSGNVRLDTCSGYINDSRTINIRKYGVQEHHIVDTVGSMTKYSKFVTSVESVPSIIQKAIFFAMEGRRGPVWVDIPSDIQTAPMPLTYSTFTEPSYIWKDWDSTELKQLLSSCQRPVVLAGYGIRQSGTVNQFRQFIEHYQIPYVSTYGARDYFPHTSPFNIGAVGVRGSRAGNFAMQNADLLLMLGTSLGTSVIGYDPKQFSPYSKKVMVDISYDELQKGIIPLDVEINYPLDLFFWKMLNE